MASECKLCALLGATNILENDEDLRIHADVHARQIQLINRFEPADKWTDPNGLEMETKSGISGKEKSKSTFVAVCREVVNIRGRNYDIKCSQCKILVRSQPNISNFITTLINHACIHFNKDLYACRHCQLKYINRRGIYTHLRKVHARFNIDDYIDMTEDHHSDIVDMIKLCFDNGPHKQLKVTAYGKQKRNNQGRIKAPLSKIACGFVVKHERGKNIQCHLCTRSIPNNFWPSITAAGLVDHVRWHLDKPIFTCCICQYSASNESTIKKHLKTKHSVARSRKNFNDGSSEYFEEISSMLEDCFGEMKRERHDVLTKEQVRARQRATQIRNHYGTNSLLAERRLRTTELVHKFHQSGKLQCRICKAHLNVVTPKGQSVHGPLLHATSHFNKVLFACHRCSYTSTTKAIMTSHIRSEHGLHGAKEFDDHTDDFHSDFMDMLSKCFDWDREPEPEGSIRGNVAAQKNHSAFIISKSYGNNLKAARNIHAYELIRKHSADGSITCRICSQATKAVDSKYKRIFTQCVFRHVASHLEKRFWPYRCKLCSKVSTNQQTIQRHVKNTHKNNGGKEFEDISDKFHAEIMECLSTCYDWGN